MEQLEYDHIISPRCYSIVYFVSNQHKRSGGTRLTQYTPVRHFPLPRAIATTVLDGRAFPRISAQTHPHYDASVTLRFSFTASSPETRFMLTSGDRKPEPRPVRFAGHAD